MIQLDEILSRSALVISLAKEMGGIVIMFGTSSFLNALQMTQLLNFQVN